MTVEQLDAIREELILADDHEDLQRAAIRLIDLLKDEHALKKNGDDPLRQLLREAYELLNDRDSRLNVQDWNREAKKWL